MFPVPIRQPRIRRSAPTARSPVVRRAIQFDGTNFDAVCELTGPGGFREIEQPPYAGVSIFIAQVYDYLHDEWINVAPGMWILEGATHKENWAVAEDEFEQLYELASEGEATS